MTANSFINELKRLLLFFPKPPLKVYSSEGCEYGNYIFYSKNLSYCFDSASCSDSFYLFDSYMCANCGDSDYAVESELCYECIDPYKCFNCDFLEYCGNMRDSQYCYDCVDCSNVFGCTHLKNKSFCIFNRQLTEQEYRETIKKYQSLPSEKVLKMLNELVEKYPFTQTNEAHNENTSYGNYFHYNKNCYFIFDAAHDENCAYLYDSFYCRDSMDMTYVGQNVELSYQIVDCPDMFNCTFCVDCKNCQDSSYLLGCLDVKNSLGCVSLNHKQYCILNRQLTKEDYEIMSTQILNELRNENINWADLIYY